MPILESQSLINLTADILARGGAEAAEAMLVAQHLVDANLMGHDSHGVGMLPAYIENLHEETALPGRSAECIRDDGSILVFDGRRGFGRRVGGEAITAAMERCRESGLVLMGLRNAHHLGRIGAFGELAVAAGLVSIHFVNVYDHRPLVAPFGGTDARFSTNPICIAMPGDGDRPPLVLDMATSRVAFGKVRVAHNEGRSLPEGLLLDKEGRPSCDPGVMFEEERGALLPFGEHKGHGLAVMCELLAGVLAGGGTMQPETPTAGGILNNMLTILVDPLRLVGQDWLSGEMAALIGHVKASPPQDPDAPVLVPGESERQTKAKRARDGISIDPVTWDEFAEAAATLGFARAELDAHVR